MSSARTGITRLLIASAMDSDVYRGFLESPEATFDAFDLTEEDRELLRHPDHRLLRVLGAALAEETSSTAGGVDTSTSPPAVVSAPPVGATPASASLPDVSLVLTLVPCAVFDGEELRHFSYATWVSPLPEGADPETLPTPPEVVFPGKPLPPLQAVVRVSAIQLRDAAGDPLVWLTASLLRGTNMTAPPPPESGGRPTATIPDRSVAAVQSAVTAVRNAPAEERYGKLVELLRVLHAGSEP